MLSLVVAAALSTACPHEASLGTVQFVRGTAVHRLSLADCRDRTVGRAPPFRQPRFADVSVRGSSLFLRLGGRSVRIAGPLPTMYGLRQWPTPVARSPDGRWLYTAGFDRIATHDKRLLIARPPAWKPRLLWNAPDRAFGSIACAPDGRSVAVQSQRSSDNGRFFATRWQLWRVGLDGSRSLLDRPSPGFADESPLWTRLGYSLGYYGHHDWQLAWHG